MTGIQALLTAISEIKFYYDEAPHGKTGMYCVWFLMPTVYEYDTGTQYLTVYPQFDFYADTKNLDDLGNLLDAVKVFEAALIKSSLSIDGYSNMKTRLTSKTEPRKDGERWRIMVEYEIMLNKE